MFCVLSLLVIIFDNDYQLGIMRPHCAIHIPFETEIGLWKWGLRMKTAQTMLLC